MLLNFPRGTIQALDWATASANPRLDMRQVCLLIPAQGLDCDLDNSHRKLCLLQGEVASHFIKAESAFD